MSSFDNSLRMVPDQRKIFRFSMDSKDDVDSLYYMVTSHISDTGKVTMYDIAKYFNSFNPEEKIELFKQVVPESGRIEELFEEPSSKEDTSQRNEDGPKQFTNSEDVSE